MIWLCWPKFDHKGITCLSPSPHTCIKSLKLYMIRVEMDLLEAYSKWSELWSVLSWQNFVLCPIRYSCPAQKLQKNKSLRENRRLKMFAEAGYHEVDCDAFILDLIWISLFLRKCTYELGIFHASQTPKCLRNQSRRARVVRPQTSWSRRTFCFFIFVGFSCGVRLCFVILIRYEKQKIGKNRWMTG